MKFEVKDQFYLDGKPFRIISGAVHYFRIVPEYWRDRLEKLKAMGCNTVETVVPWNVHEPEKGHFVFDGMADIEGFIRTAQDLGLCVIIRPSPYICAEWEFGGIPAWLLKDADVKVRSRDPRFLEAFQVYYDRLFEILTPLQVDYGGPIILMQIENEYGYFGTDHEYMKALKKMMEDRGVVVPFMTSDGPYAANIEGGSLPDVLPTGNFGSDAKERFALFQKYTGNRPLMCAEFWVGWFDNWGNGGHMTGNLEKSVEDLDQILQMGSVNFYMFQGGTNFGFMNGSNYYDELSADVTSYDYDGILTEDGQITDKYRRFQEVIGRHAPIPEVALTTEIRRRDYGTVTCDGRVSLFDALEDLTEPVKSPYPLSMERVGQNYGYILYRSVLETEDAIDKIRFWDANDRVSLYLNQEQKAVYYDRELLKEQELKVRFKKGTVLDLLVENMGRVNFGPPMNHQRKGIDGCVTLDGHMQDNWEIFPLPLDHVDLLQFGPAPDKDHTEKKEPAFYHFSFQVSEKCDTFLDLDGWGKGCAFLNGFNLGRYWEIGPQRRLYIPAPLLREGENELVIFETENKNPGAVTFMDTPDLG